MAKHSDLRMWRKVKKLGKPIYEVTYFDPEDSVPVKYFASLEICSCWQDCPEILSYTTSRETALQKRDELIGDGAVDVNIVTKEAR